MLHTGSPLRQVELHSPRLGVWTGLGTPVRGKEAQKRLKTFFTLEKPGNTAMVPGNHGTMVTMAPW